MSQFATSSQFFDLNILHDPKTPATTVELVRMAIQLGYDCVAINTDIGDVDENTEQANICEGATGAMKKKKAKLSCKEIPAPFTVPLEQLDTSILQASGRRFQQYSRLTMAIGDSSHVYSFLKTNHPIVSKYDIIAVCPKTEQVLQALTTKLDVEIITFDVSATCPWLKRSNLIQLAIKRSVSFELSYASALCDSSTRRQVFSNAKELYRATGGHNVVLTSRAVKPIDLRAPLDAAHLAVLFGRTAQDGRRALSADARRVVLHAATRRTIKGAMQVQPLATAPPDLLAKLLTIPEFQQEAEVSSLDPVVQSVPEPPASATTVLHTQTKSGCNKNASTVNRAVNGSDLSEQMSVTDMTKSDGGSEIADSSFSSPILSKKKKRKRAA